jgi:hypothetical protein
LGARIELTKISIFRRRLGVAERVKWIIVGGFLFQGNIEGGLRWHVSMSKALQRRDGKAVKVGGDMLEGHDVGRNRGTRYR